MQLVVLAYVSTGSFISPGGRSLSDLFQGGGREPKSPKVGKPSAAAMPRGEKIMMMMMLLLLLLLL